MNCLQDWLGITQDRIIGDIMLVEVALIVGSVNHGFPGGDGRGNDVVIG